MASETNNRVKTSPVDIFEVNLNKINDYNLLYTLKSSFRCVRTQSAQPWKLARAAKYTCGMFSYPIAHVFVLVEFALKTH